MASIEQFADPATYKKDTHYACNLVDDEGNECGAIHNDEDGFKAHLICLHNVEFQQQQQQQDAEPAHRGPFSGWKLRRNFTATEEGDFKCNNCGTHYQPEEEEAARLHLRKACKKMTSPPPPPPRPLKRPLEVLEEAGAPGVDVLKKMHADIRQMADDLTVQIDAIEDACNQSVLGQQEAINKLQDEIAAAREKANEETADMRKRRQTFMDYLERSG